MKTQESLMPAVKPETPVITHLLTCESIKNENIRAPPLLVEFPQKRNALFPTDFI